MSLKRNKNKPEGPPSECFRVLLALNADSVLEQTLQPFLRTVEGFKTRTVYTEAELKVALEEDDWAMILSQFEMTGWDVFGLLKYVVEETPVVAIGNQVSGELVARFMEQSPVYRYFEEKKLESFKNWLKFCRNAYLEQDSEDGETLKILKTLIQQKQEEYFFRAMNACIVGVFRWYKDGRIISANQTFLNMLGYTREEFEKNSLDWVAITPPEYLPLDEKALATLKQHGEVSPYEKQYFRKDGSRVDILIGRLSYGKDNGDTGIAFILDISQLKANEQKLQEIRANLLSAQRIANLGSWNYTTAGKSFYGSEELYRIVGVPVGTPLASREHFLPHVHPDDRIGWGKSFDDMLKNGTYYHEYRIIRPDGELRHVQAQGEAAFDAEGKMLSMYGTILDITERKRTEEALMLLTVQQEALLNNIPDLVWMKDLDFNFIAMNEPGTKFLKQPLEKILGKPLSDFVSKDYAERQLKVDRQVMETGQRITVEDPFILEDGRKLWLETIRSPIFDSAGELIGLTGTAKDITRRKEYDEALLLSNELLEKKVAERTMELQAANRILQENEQLRSTFVSSLTHDLRTPLIAQTRLIELLLAQCLDDNGKIAFLSQGLMKNNENLLDMVNKLLETYQYVEGKILLQKESFELYYLAEECCDILQEMATSKGIQMCNQIASGFPSLFADRSLIKRVFINLLGNAVENVPQGCRVEIKAIDMQNRVKLEVSDNGNGIEPEFVPYMFRRYAPRSRRRQKLGSGLGLFICKAIVELHQGTISVNSELGQGTTFTVLLPKLDMADEQSEQVGTPRMESL